MQIFPKRDNTPDFSNPAVRQAFTQEAHDSKTLWQKELEVNQVEQNLLTERVRLMKSFMNELPATDSQYSMLAVQIQMDQIEIDELKFRQALLVQKLQMS